MDMLPIQRPNIDFATVTSQDLVADELMKETVVENQNGKFLILNILK